MTTLETMSSMAADTGPVNIRTITRLASDLYLSCDRASRDAPDGFRQLVRELDSLQAALRTLRDDVSSNMALFERLDNSRKQNFHRRLDLCFDTLQRLEDLMAAYRDMGIFDGKQFWQRVKWTTQRGRIELLKSEVMVHCCCLPLCMSSLRK